VILIAPLLLVAASSAPAAPSSPAPAALRSTIDRVAAVVNGDVITLRDLERAGGSALSEADSLPPGPQRDRARAQVLRTAFDLVLADRLFQQQVSKLQLEVSDAQVDAQIQAIKEQNHFDDAMLDRALTSQGFTRASYREQLRTQLQNFAVLQYKVGGRVRVSDQELENYYRSHPQEFQGETEIHVRHIFLPLSESAPPGEVRRAEAEGEGILQRLRAGEDFAKVAREVSRGPSAQDGGDLGWLRRGAIQKTLEEAAFALKDGQVSGLVRATNGIHIIRVDEHRTAAARTFAEVKETIRDRLVNEQADSYRAQYVAELRRDALIETPLPDLQQH